MSVSFYDHPVTGKLHFRATAGGAGAGATGQFDAPATAVDIERNRVEYGAYLRRKSDGPTENKSNKTDMTEKNLYIADLETALARATAIIEALNAEIARLKA